MDELLLTDTVTLLSADIEDSARLRQTQPTELSAALERLDQILADAVPAYGGVRAVEQPPGESLVVAFGRAQDAVECALQLQQAPLAPIRLCIGIHTGEVARPRDDGTYVGPTIDRTARLRDLARGGQTLLSAATKDIVINQLPEQAWLTDRGLAPLRDLIHFERVAQLCHPNLRNEFPPLCVTKSPAASGLPVHLTSFVGRGRELAEVHGLVVENRLVTLIGSGGVGKSRLAEQVVAQLAAQFVDGVRYVDLGSITDPAVAPITMARALGLPNQPGRSAMDTLLHHLGDRQMLLLVDNCEHLLDASAPRLGAMLRDCPGLRLLVTSREPIKVAGEVTWRVPPLAVGDAIALFTDRARLAQPDFALTDDNAGTVSQICRRLDTQPLGIELAAARVRTLSLAEISAGLDDKIRLLTGGARTAVPRQQTLRASLEWSHGLLTDTERVLFRRLGVFVGGFDLQAAQAVAAFGDVHPRDVLGDLSQLVDKSLVVADSSNGRTRYRRFEGVGQLALEKLREAGEADIARARHCDHYTAVVAPLDLPARADYDFLLARVEGELENLRAASAWLLESSDGESALMLASRLQPLWLVRGRISEGRSWFDAALAGASVLEVSPTVRARALADAAVLTMFVDAATSLESAAAALAIARELDDPASLVRALTACGLTASFSHHTEAVGQYFAEAASLAEELDDQWGLSQILSWQSNAAVVAGDAIAARRIGTEGRDLADAIGDRFNSWLCRLSLGYAQLWQGDLTGATTQFGALSEAENLASLSSKGLGDALAYRGDVDAARTAAEAALERAAESSEYALGLGYSTVALAALAGGDVETARNASDLAWHKLSVQPYAAMFWHSFRAEIALACGNVAGAKRCADEAVSVTTGWHRALALTTRARVAMAEGEPEQAERAAYEALTCAADVGARTCLPDILECLGALAADQGRDREAARVYGAAEGIRQRIGAMRFKIYDAGYQKSVAALPATMSTDEFDTAWAHGAAFSAEEAIDYLQHGRGERKRATSGWAALTRAELNVVRLVGQGLSNKDIAQRLFLSPRTVQTHLTHVYTKLGFNSRVQLAQQAAQHS